MGGKKQKKERNKSEATLCTCGGKIFFTGREEEISIHYLLYLQKKDGGVSQETLLEPMKREEEKKGFLQSPRFASHGGMGHPCHTVRGKRGGGLILNSVIPAHWREGKGGEKRLSLHPQAQEKESHRRK